MGDDRLEAIFRKVAARVSPTPAEAKIEKQFAEGLQSKLQHAFGKAAQVLFVGSTARDTGLKGDKDLDLFVTFPQDKEKEEIVAATVSIVKAAIPAKWEMHYAEHPYLQGVVGNFKVEVIPCYRIEAHQQIISAVDRTPLHMDYLQKALSTRQRRDVRVMKHLLKSHGLYGAELEIEGFSGLVCEYLMLNYRSLAGIVKAVSEWKPPLVIDMLESADEEELKKRFSNALILIDVIDKNRNAAAAVSETNVYKFIALCRALLKQPSEKLFLPQTHEVSKSKLAAALSKRLYLALLEMQTPANIVSDILVPQLRRTQKSLAKQLEISDFNVFGSHSFSTRGKSYVLLELESPSASKLERLEGPPVDLPKQVSNFVAKHASEGVARGPFVEGKKVVIERERKGVDAIELLKNAMREPAMHGVASYYAKPFKSARIIDGHKAVLAVASKDKAFAQKLAEYLFRQDSYLA